MTENDTPDGRLRVALVGCGRIARAHMDAYAKLTDQAEVAAFVDRDLARAQAFAEEYGVRHALADIPAACGAAGPEAVDLCLPPSEHCPMTVQAADAGCHVLVEKPLSVTCAQADEMIEAGRRNGVVVMSGQSRRFNGPLRAMKRILDDGAIGAPLLAGIIGGGPTRQAATPWWADPAVTGPSNLLYNWGSHFLDWLRYLYGVPCRLYAEGRDTGDVVAGIDTLSVVCGFASSDLIATVCWTYRTQALAGGLHCCCGTEGTVRIAEKGQVLLNGEPVEVPDPRSNQFDTMIREFCDAIRQGRQPETSAADCRIVIELIEAVLESCATHRPVAIGRP